MDFGIIRKAGDPTTGEAEVVQVILTTHYESDVDTTPLQMVSAARLARLLAIERAYDAIVDAALSLDEELHQGAD